MDVAPARGRSLGATVQGSLTRFAAFVTSSDTCLVRLFGADGQARATYAMDPCGHGYFEYALEHAGHGTLYKFVVNGEELPDPYARYLPAGVFGPAMVVESHYAWRNGSGVERPLAEQILYELHVGTFTEDGSYDSARARLGYLADLGITTVELMPLAAFAGSRGWGYDGVAHYAPFAPYGTPDELRAFVDEAHGLGLAVILDVVYNHFGPRGNFLRQYSPLYFASNAQSAWGDAPDFAEPPMRDYVLRNAHYWLTEFNFDGLRLDAVHAIVDDSPRHILRELASEVAQLEPRRVLIAEDYRNDRLCIDELGLDAMWADDFHHATRVTLTGERDGYYQAYEPGAHTVAATIQRGWLYEGQFYPPMGQPRGKPAGDMPASSFIYCLQNHDQIGNRALGNRLTDDVSVDAFCAASMLLFVLPMTPLIFMGQEWGASSPFLYFTDHDPELGKLIAQGRQEEFKAFRAFTDPVARQSIPDPQRWDTFARSHLRWQERLAGQHERIASLYRKLILLRKTDPVLRRGGRAETHAEARGQTLVVRRRSGASERVLLVNFASLPTPLGDLSWLEEGLVPLLTSGEGYDGRTLPAWSAVLLADRAMRR